MLDELTQTAAVTHIIAAVSHLWAEKLTTEITENTEKN